MSRPVPMMSQSTSVMSLFGVRRGGFCKQKKLKQKLLVYSIVLNFPNAYVFLYAISLLLHLLTKQLILGSILFFLFFSVKRRVQVSLWSVLAAVVLSAETNKGGLPLKAAKKCPQKR